MIVPNARRLVCPKPQWFWKLLWLGRHDARFGTKPALDLDFSDSLCVDLAPANVGDQGFVNKLRVEVTTVYLGAEPEVIR